MRQTLSFIAAFIFFHSSYSQVTKSYSSFVKLADSLYQAKDYLKSGKMYSEAFQVNGNKGLTNDRYNAACSWALAGVADSAFLQLNKIVNIAKYKNYGHITTDLDLVSLYTDSRWNPIIEKVKLNKEQAEVNLNKPLAATLDSIYVEDQKYRQQIDEIINKFGRDSKEMRNHWNMISEKDSINLIKVKSILDKYGWLGADVVGDQGNTTLFLVIQHSDLETQLKYLPIMREAVKKGNAKGSSLALLEDRVALGQGKRQIFGSQIGTHPVTQENCVLPLEDAVNVDKRRAEVGLGPLSEYVSRWNIKWDAEQYQKDLPFLEEKLKTK